MAMGLAPLVYWDKELEDYIVDGSYEYHLEMNDRPGNRIEVCIRYIVDSCYHGESGEVISIRLSREEQKTVLGSLDEQCRQFYGKSCADMLAEARARMEEDMS